MPMKPYDPAAKCPKCGHPVVTTNFCAGHDEEGYHKPLIIIPSHHGEALHRQCMQCGYGWLEACVKAQEEK